MSSSRWRWRFPRNSRAGRRAGAGGPGGEHTGHPARGGHGAGGWGHRGGAGAGLFTLPAAITELDVQQRTVRVDPGVVLDQLNHFLHPHGLRFGPDVATSSRATLGGMIANNSSGSHTPVYGTTADHLNELEALLADGRVVTVGAGPRNAAEAAGTSGGTGVFQCAGNCRAHGRRACSSAGPGYALDRCAREPDNLNHVLCGSEGTLAAIISAELKLVPLPREKGLALIFFASVAEAMQATVGVAGFETCRRRTHGSRAAGPDQRTTGIPGGARVCSNWSTGRVSRFWLVEFFDEVVAGRSAELDAAQLGLRTLVIKTPAQRPSWCGHCAKPGFR